MEFGAMMARWKRKKDKEADGLMYESSDEEDDREFRERWRNQNQMGELGLLNRINNQFQPRGMERIRQLIQESQ